MSNPPNAASIGVALRWPRLSTRPGTAPAAGGESPPRSFTGWGSSESRSAKGFGYLGFPACWRAVTRQQIEPSALLLRRFRLNTPRAAHVLPSSNAARDFLFPFSIVNYPPSVLQVCKT